MQGRKTASRKNHLTTMAPAAVLAASAAPAGRTLELINGDRLLVRTGPTGRPLVSVRQAAGYLASLVTITTCGVISDAPLAAMPYLGQGLDPTLFRLSDLQRAERDGRLPVCIRYIARLRPIPGITVTRGGRGVAAGDHAERLSGGGAHCPAVAAFHQLDRSWLVALGEPGRRPARSWHAAGVHLGAADFSAGPWHSLRLQPGLRRSAGHDPSPALHSQRRLTGGKCLVPLRY